MKELDIINYGNCISASRPDCITTGTVWIGRSNDKNGVYPTTQLLNGVARVSIKMKELDIINYGIYISASRPDRITTGTVWIGARMIRMECTPPHNY
jgi:nitrous oxidase accessory protein NosD